MKNKFQVDLTPELLKRAQERIDFILEKGCVHNGVSDKFDSNVKPDWYDEERFRKAQKIAKEYLVSISNSSLIGLLLVLQQPIGLIPLLSTNQSKNVSKLFSRYLNTVLHVNDWYKYDPFDPKSRAYKSQQMVKTMHKNVGKLMNLKPSVYEFVKKFLEEQNKENNNNNEVSEEDVIKLITNKERVWVSQTDMALTQHSFIGMIILEPYACGMHGGTKEKLVEIAYIWKVLGYKIGIEDQFNLFYDLEFDFLYAMCKLLLEQIFLPVCENASTPVGIKMTKSLLLGFRPLVPYLRWKLPIKHWYKILNINAHKLNNVDLNNEKYEFVKYPIKHELSEEERKLQIANGYNDKYIVPNPHVTFEEIKLEKFSEKFYYNLFMFYLKKILKVGQFRDLARKINKGRANRALRQKNKHIDFMKEKYDKNLKNHISSCPFAGEISNQYYEYSDVKK